MANAFQKFAIATASVTLSLAVVDINPAKAAMIAYDFDVIPDLGPLVGESYDGFLSYDDSFLTGSGKEFIPVSDLSFNFLDVYSEVDGLAEPKVVFLDGNFLGLTFSAEEFSFIPGFFDLSGAYFAYDIDLGVGTANVIYTPHTSVPEPNTLLGLTLLGGSWLVNKTIRASKKR